MGVVDGVFVRILEGDMPGEEVGNWEGELGGIGA